MTLTLVGKKLVACVAPAIAAMLFAAPAQAELLSEITFGGGTVGQTLADNSAINGTGMVADFNAFTNRENFSYVAGLTGSLGSFDNAIQTNGSSTRARAIIDRTTTAWVGSGLLEDPADTSSLIGAEGGTLFGSFLVNNSAAALGFAGLEFAAGDPNSNRVVTIGEADNATSTDFVVLGPGQAGQIPANDLALPAIVPGETREIVFRIDYGVSNADTFTLINSDLTDGISGMGDFTFSTLHLASFGGSPSITYDDIRLGEFLGNVTFVEGFVEPIDDLLGDFDNDDDVDIDDLDQYIGNLGKTIADNAELAELDLDANGTIEAADFEQHYGTLVAAGNGVNGVLAGDANFDGTVDVLGDAAALVNNLGQVATSWAQGDFNADGQVDVLGDAAILVNNLGASNTDGASGPATSAVPEPSSIMFLALTGFAAAVRRKR